MRIFMLRQLCSSMSWTRLSANLVRAKGINYCLNTSSARRPVLLNPSTVMPGQVAYRCCHTDTKSELSELEYNTVADKTLDALADVFEDLPEQLTCDPEYDVVFVNGVLTVKISQQWGTYVINKQAPNKQIWLSSPVSGPKRYDYAHGSWVYSHDGVSLQSLLTTEISQALGQHIDFTNGVADGNT